MTIYLSYNDPKGPGSPIRKSVDQRLFATSHGLSQRTTSFIASWRQGIHQMLLKRLITRPSVTIRKLWYGCERPKPLNRNKWIFYPRALVSLRPKSNGHNQTNLTHVLLHNVQKPDRINQCDQSVPKLVSCVTTYLLCPIPAANFRASRSHCSHDTGSRKWWS